MCARFFVDDEVMEMVSEITASQDAGIADLRQGDVRPSGQAPIITGKQNDLRADVMVWGFPRFDGKGLIINARSESATENLSKNDTVRNWLHDTVEQLIQWGADDFLLGGYGGFDQYAASVVWELKRKYPHIHSTLVLLYLDRKVDDTKYDSTTYPPLEKVPKRYAISKRNEWMVNEADIVVAYVTHNWGGAATTLAYARHRKKEIILFGTE